MSAISKTLQRAGAQGKARSHDSVIVRRARHALFPRASTVPIDCRWQVDNPFYHLTTPNLTPGPLWNQPTVSA